MSDPRPVEISRETAATALMYLEELVNYVHDTPEDLELAMDELEEAERSGLLPRLEAAEELIEAQNQALLMAESCREEFCEGCRKISKALALYVAYMELTHGKE